MFEIIIDLISAYLTLFIYILLVYFVDYLVGKLYMKKEHKELSNILNYINEEKGFIDLKSFYQWIFDFGYLSILFKHYNIILHYIDYHNELVDRNNRGIYHV